MKISKTLFAAAALVLAASANATVIDFEGYEGFFGHLDGFQVDDLTVTAFSNSSLAALGDLVGAGINGSNTDSCLDGIACPHGDSTVYFASLNDGALDIAKTNTSTFKIKSFDASFLGTTGTSYGPVAGLLKIQGVHADGSAVTETYNLAGPTAGGFNFQHFTTSAAFGNQDFSQAYIFGYACNTAGSCKAFSNDQAQFAIDNIAAVPEPTTYMMFGLGLLGMAAFARRRSL